VSCSASFTVVISPVSNCSRLLVSWSIVVVVVVVVV